MNAYVVATKSGGNSLPSNIASVTTWAELPTWAVIPLTAADKSITGFWSEGNNSDGTRYTMELSTTQTFTPSFNIQSIDSTKATATRDGLFSNTTYWARLTAFERPTDPTLAYTALQSTVTLAAVPTPVQVGDSLTPGTTFVIAHWSSNQNAPDTVYKLSAFTDEDYSQLLSSTESVGTSDMIAALTPNVTYWFSVQAKDRDDGVYTDPLELGLAVTLPGAFTVASSSDPSMTIWYGINAPPDTVRFTFTYTPLANQSNSFRYIWLANQSTFNNWNDPAVSVWSGASPLVVDTTQTGIYWLHVKAYNAQGLSSDQAEIHVGPFQVDARAPRPDPEQFADIQIQATTIARIAAQTTDDSESGFSAGNSRRNRMDGRSNRPTSNSTYWLRASRPDSRPILFTA